MHYCNREVVYVSKTRLEPISDDILCSVKEHLRISFDSDDAYLKGLIEAAADALELYTNRAFTVCEIKAILKGGGVGELPFYSESISDLVITHNGDVKLPKMHFDSLLELTHPHLEYNVEYKTGYAILPIQFVSAICNVVAYMYNNRGDNVMQNVNILQLVPSFMNQYKRVTWSIV